MPRRRRATLRSAWWKDQLRRLVFCFACGGKLKKLYVPAEKKRRHVCRRCGQITYLNPKIVAGVIPTLADGRVVLLRRNIEPALGRWTYPAGFQELGESVAQAAERETWEEIMARVRLGPLVGIYSYEDAAVVTLVYEGRLKKGEKPRPGIEAKEIGLFQASDIPWTDLAFRSTAEALQDWIKLKRRKKK